MLFLLPRSPSLSPILLHAFRPPVSGFSRQWPALAFFPLCSLGGSFFIGASGRTSTTGFRTLKNRNRPVNPVTFSNEHSNNISHSPQKLSRPTTTSNQQQPPVGQIPRPQWLLPTIPNLGSYFYLNGFVGLGPSPRQRCSKRSSYLDAPLEFRRTFVFRLP